MGYSCTRDAVRMLGLIQHAYATPNGGSNGVTLKGKDYFFERGKEQADGSITGSVYSMRGYKAGQFRIAPDGTIARFPRLSTTEKEELENSFRDLSARNPSLLDSYDLGVT